MGKIGFVRLKKVILEYAEGIGNCAKACREWGVPRSAFQEWKVAYARHGEAGLVRKKPIAYSAWDSESIENPTQELSVQDIAGGRPISIFKAQFFSSCRWSPDGSELLFTEVTDSVKKGSHIVPRLGGTSRQRPALLRILILELSIVEFPVWV